MILDNSSFIEVLDFSSDLCDLACVFHGPCPPPCLIKHLAGIKKTGSGEAKKKHSRFLSDYRHPDG